MAAVFTCSIDDGHPLDMRMAELLYKHGLNCTFYVPISNREGPPVMTKRQLMELSARFEIGSHTQDHCYLNSVSLTEATYQINAGKRHLEDLVEHEVDGFCYPGGKFSSSYIALVRDAGFKYARTTTNLCIDTGISRFELPTTIQFYPHSKAVYLRNFLRAGRWFTRAPGLYQVLRKENWVERIHALFNYCCERGGTFHLWAHTIDIDQLAIWQELDHFLAHVATCIPPENRLSNQQVAQHLL